jgi:hypothetical protein
VPGEPGLKRGVETLVWIATYASVMGVPSPIMVPSRGTEEAPSPPRLRGVLHYVSCLLGGTMVWSARSATPPSSAGPRVLNRPKRPGSLDRLPQPYCLHDTQGREISVWQLTYEACLDDMHKSCVHAGLGAVAVGKITLLHRQTTKIGS